MRIAGLILAAGEGRRFGGPKQLAELWGRPLVSHAVRAALAVPAFDRVVVVVGSYADEVGAVARAEGAEVVHSEDWAQGNVASLRAGLDAVADSEAVIVTLGDQPLVTADAIGHFAALAPTVRLAARATYGGCPGHPVVLRRALYGEVRRARTQQGLRNLLNAVGVLGVAADAWARPDDVDTVTDLERLAISP